MNKDVVVLIPVYDPNEKIMQEFLDKLAKSKVMVFGVGGVGSFTVEALARAGVGNLILVDDDTVCLTNLNRQIHATYKTISKNKVEVMKERVLSDYPDQDKYK